MRADIGKKRADTDKRGRTSISEGGHRLRGRTSIMRADIVDGKKFAMANALFYTSMMKATFV